MRRETLKLSVEIKFEFILHKPWLRSKALRQSMHGWGWTLEKRVWPAFGWISKCVQNLFQAFINGLIEKKLRRDLELTRPVLCPQTGDHKTS